MRRRFRFLSRPALALALVSALGVAVAPAGARAEGGRTATPAPPLSTSLTGMARAEYEAGKLLYQDGDYQNALVKFTRVYELSHDGRLLWNMAVCEKNLRHYTRVLALLDRYLTEAGSLLSAADRQEAKDLEGAARPLVSTLWIMVTEPGATIVVDDAEAGVSPLAKPLQIDLGKRRIRIEKAGFKPFNRVEDVAGGTELHLSAELEKEVHRGRVAITAAATDLIAVDGKAVGRGAWAGALASGGHTIRVTAPGMAVYQTEVLVQDDKSRQIAVTLTPAVKASNPAPWLWLAGGAVAVVGAGIVGAVLFARAPHPNVDGTLGTYPLSFGGPR